MFNTLKYANLLEEVGFSREQAETSVKILVEIMEDKLASKEDLQRLDVAHKQDVKNSEFALRQDIQIMESSIRSDMQKMEGSIRSDMQKMEGSIRSDMQTMESSLKNEILGLSHTMLHMESKLTVRMGAMLGASIAVLAAIIKLT